MIKYFRVASIGLMSLGLLLCSLIASPQKVDAQSNLTPAQTQELIQSLITQLNSLQALLNKLIADQDVVITPVTKGPTISSVESKTNNVGVIESGRKASIHGTGLSGRLTIKLGIQEPRYVYVTGTSDAYAEFVVPQWGHSAGVSMFVTNSSGITSLPYSVDIISGKGGIVPSIVSVSYVSGKDSARIDGSRLKDASVYFDGKLISKSKITFQDDSKISFIPPTYNPGRYPIYVSSKTNGTSNTVYLTIEYTDNDVPVDAEISYVQSFVINERNVVSPDSSVRVYGKNIGAFKTVKLQWQDYSQLITVNRDSVDTLSFKIPKYFPSNITEFDVSVIKEGVWSSNSVRVKLERNLLDSSSIKNVKLFTVSQPTAEDNTAEVNMKFINQPGTKFSVTIRCDGEDIKFASDDDSYKCGQLLPLWKLQYGWRIKRIDTNQKTVPVKFILTGSDGSKEVVVNFQPVKNSISTSWKTYKNDSYGFEVKYPLYWTSKGYFSEHGGFFYVAFGTTDSIDSEPLASIRVYPNQTTLDKFVKYFSRQNNKLSNTTLGGVAAKELYFIGDNSIPYMVVGSVNGSYGYELSSTAFKEDSVDIVRNMALTFRFTNSN